MRALSAFRKVKHGVPQGSNLGPLLFLLYINDLPNVSSVLSLILFADDTNAFYSHSCYRTLFQTVNGELEAIANWFSANRLSLNLEKTNFILFRCHKKICPPCNSQNLSINGTTISQVDTTKFLGVHIDEHLTWREHIRNISAKIAKNVGILQRISYVIPPSIRLKLYYSLVYPYLSYCNLIWASTYKSRLHKLVILQKRAVRAIAGISYRTHTSPTFLEFKLLKFHQIKIYQIGVFMYRYANGSLPPVFKGYFQQGSDLHPYFTRRANQYRTFNAYSNSCRFSIKFGGIGVWNSIPFSLKLAHNLQCFKKSFRNQLLNDGILV